ncbi:MAG: serine/threonine-protein kinase [Planctomycetota bacterium]
MSIPESSASGSIPETWLESQVVAFQQNGETASEAEIERYLTAVDREARQAFGADRGARATAALGRRLRSLGAADHLLRAIEPVGGAGEAPKLAGYVVVGALGQGGYGRVYRAREPRLDRDVALKVPLLGAVLTERDRVRLGREAQAIARLNHPGIVTLHRLVEHEGQPILVMELVEGAPLDQVLADVGAGARTLGEALGQAALSDVEAACELLRQVLDALQYAHAHGVVHRDLKPSNVMVDVDGRVRLLDFGLARTEDAASLTRSTELLGTPQFMAPELLDDPSRVGAWSDIYAAGVLLYELLTRSYPFGRGALDTVLSRIRAGDVVPLRSVRREVPRDLAAVVETAMAVQPAQRYPTAAAFADDLARFGAGVPTAARPVRWLGRLARRARRRPDLAIAAGLLLMVTVAASGFGVRTLHAAEQRARQHNARIDAAHARARAAFAEQAWRRGVDALRGVDDLIEEPATRPERRRAHTALHEGVAVVTELERLRDDPSPDDFERLGAAFAAGFARLGFDFEGDEAQCAARLAEHEFRQPLMVALDDWLRVTVAQHGREAARAQQLARVADGADEDAVRRRIRAAFLGADTATLREIAESDVVLDLSAPVLSSLTESLRTAGEDDAADRVVRLGPLLHPQDFWMHRRLAQMLLETREELDRRMALQALRSALVLRPDDPEVLADLAITFEVLLENELAVRAARRAIALDPSIARAHMALGSALQELGRRDEALVCLQRFIELSEGEQKARGHVLSALLLEMGGEPEKATEHHERAAALVPDSASYAAFFARNVRLTSRDNHRAERILRDAVRVDPTNDRILAFLAETLEARGAPAEALVEHERAVALGAPRVDRRRVYLVHVASLAVAQMASAVTASERQRLRAVARDCLLRSLRVSLHEAARRPESARAVAGFLRSWRDRPLDALREPALAELSREERAACVDLWQRFDVVYDLVADVARGQAAPVDAPTPPARDGAAPGDARSR